MKRRLWALALLTCSLAVSACAPQRVLVPLPIPSDRIDCQEVVPSAERPVIPPEYVIDWAKVATVDQARREHDAFVQRLRERERAVTGYVVHLESRLFVCADDAAWVRDFQQRLDAPEQAP